MTLKLGPQDEPLNVSVKRNATWWSVLHDTEGNWPAGISIELRFEFTDRPNVVWPATIAADMATWIISKTAVADLVALEPRMASVWYIDPSIPAEFPWAEGTVQIS